MLRLVAVFQVGMPSDREQYIHRLGRTGRKGKQGEGILLLAPWEEFFVSSIKDLPVSKAPAPLIDPETRKKVSSLLCFPSLSTVLGRSKYLFQYKDAFMNISDSLSESL